MSAWHKQLAPYLILLSIVGNVYLGSQLYSRDQHLNLVTWGNYVDSVWKYFNWVSLDIAPRTDGRVMNTTPQNVAMARESLDALRSLPNYNQRIDEADLRTMEQILRYANEAYAVAAREQGQTGVVSAESAERLKRLREAFELVIRHQGRTNELKTGRNPWNHSEWKAVFRSVATGLRSMEFIPLPQ